MTKNKKVFGGTLNMGARGYLRAIVAVSSRDKAAKILRISSHEVRTYWALTGNKTELAIALAKPETVFVALDKGERNFEAVNYDLGVWRPLIWEERK